jgi:hypothetical protein
VKTTRAAGFGAFSLPIDRFTDAEHLYSATGLAPADHRSATLARRCRQRVKSDPVATAENGPPPTS